MRYLGLDIGDRWIGVALSDPLGKLASPLTIIKREEDLAELEAIAHIIDQYEIKRVIVGLPRTMDGSLGRQADKVEAFIQKLRNHIEVPVDFRDERLTTVSARRMMREIKTKKGKKKRDDAIAAAVILQAFLDEVYNPLGKL
jgi:putative Holliday junction resolvase